MTSVEFAIMDEVYFPASFDTVIRNAGKREEAEAALNALLQKGYVTQLVFNEAKKDFDRLETPDPVILQKSFFVASKKGLLAHNGADES